MKDLLPIEVPDVPWPTASTDKLHNYDQAVAMLKELERDYREDVKLEVIGKSIEGRDIHLVAIGHGEKKFLVQCREHPAEVAGMEAMLDYMPELAGENVDGAKKIKEKCTLLVIPMLAADMADLYTKTRSTVPNIKEETLDLWHERAKKYPYYKFLYLTLYHELFEYAHYSSDYFDMITTHKNPVTGLTEYVSHLENWTWLDAVNMHGCVGISGDFWQLKLPENQAFYRTLMRYKPQYFVTLHGGPMNNLRMTLTMRGRSDSLYPLTPDGKMKHGFWARPAVNTQFYANDVDAAIKGVFLGNRYADPRYLRFSNLPLSKKSMKGYRYPSLTDWEMTESYKIAKIANAAVEDEDKVGAIPIYWNAWAGTLAGAGGSRQAVSLNPEFQCASIVNEARGGHHCGQLGYEMGMKNNKTSVHAILRYLAGLELPRDWDEFPVFQGPYDVWSKKEFAERRYKSDPEFFDRWYPEEEVVTPQPR